MEKTRVNKGERYWIVLLTGNGCRVIEAREGEVTSSKPTLNDECYEFGNYFHTREEAESMANKLRAVLKGADVIEMPSEEEYEKIIPQRICSDEFASGEDNGYWNGYNYLKSKIVK